MKSVSIFFWAVLLLEECFCLFEVCHFKFFPFYHRKNRTKHMIYVYLFDILSTDYDITINRIFIFTFANSYDTNMYVPICIESFEKKIFTYNLHLFFLNSYRTNLKQTEDYIHVYWLVLCHQVGSLLKFLLDIEYLRM